MCEPAHSVVQYDPFDDDHFGGTLDVETILSKFGNWAKKVGQWFHISKMGAGHSKATMHGRRQLLYLPEPVNYEGFWWEKGRFALDGWGSHPDEEQFEAAKEYHMRSCMGSMRIFRRFLEASMRNSSMPYMYAVRFKESILTPKGRDLMDGKIRLLNPRELPLEGKMKGRFIKLVMGFTRKRGLLVPEWSMDDEFWSIT